MKQLPSLFTTITISVLVFLLLRFGLPNHPLAATSAAAAFDATPTSPENAAAGCSSTRSVQVSGTAVVNVTPDRALIQLGVQSNGATTQAVEASNTAAIQAVIKAIRAQGVEAKDIATDNYVIEPIYDDYASLYIKGYRINNLVAVTLRDVSKASAVMGAALQAGANQVVNGDFYTSELRQYRDQARALAMKAAQEKAQALAQTAGAGIGCVLTINENSYSYYNGWWYGYGRSASQNLMTQNVMQNVAPNPSTAAGSGDEPISLGQISVKAEINASFGIK